MSFMVRWHDKIEIFWTLKNYKILNKSLHILMFPIVKCPIDHFSIDCSVFLHDAFVSEISKEEPDLIN